MYAIRRITGENQPRLPTLSDVGEEMQEVLDMIPVGFNELRELANQVGPRALQKVGAVDAKYFENRWDEQGYQFVKKGTGTITCFTNPKGIDDRLSENPWQISKIHIYVATPNGADRCDLILERERDSGVVTVSLGLEERSRRFNLYQGQTISGSFYYDSDWLTAMEVYSYNRYFTVADVRGLSSAKKPRGVRTVLMNSPSEERSARRTFGMSSMQEIIDKIFDKNP